MDIRINCPKCGHRFNLRAANPSALMTKNFKCPKCGGMTPFAVLLRQAGFNGAPAAGGPNPLKTHLAGGAPPNPLKTNLAGGMMVNSGGIPMQMPGGTQVVTPQVPGGTQVASPQFGAPQAAPNGDGLRGMMPNRKRAFLLVKESGQLFPLSMGQFILGRDSSDSRATLRLAADPYMSRNHAHLSVSYGATGFNRLVLTPMNSQNVVYVNNSKLAPGASIELHPGDEVLLGMTTIQYIEK